MTIEEPNQPLIEALNFRVSSEVDYKLSNHSRLTIDGCNEPAALAAFLATSKKDFKNLSKPQLILLESEAQVEPLSQALALFGSTKTAHFLPAYDVSPYSGLYPNPRKISQRLTWLFKAQNADLHDIFLATPVSLLQQTMPFKILAENCHSIEVDSELPQELTPLLDRLGYSSTPVVEDFGQYSSRGGIVDIYSPAHKYPVRIECFGDLVESMRHFDPQTQLSIEKLNQFKLIPAKEILFDDNRLQSTLKKIHKKIDETNIDSEEVRSDLHSLARGHYFHGIEYLLSYFYEERTTALDHFLQDICVWRLDSLSLTRLADDHIAQLKQEYRDNMLSTMSPEPSQIYSAWSEVEFPEGSQVIDLSQIIIQDESVPLETLSFKVSEIINIQSPTTKVRSQQFIQTVNQKLGEWLEQDYKIFICAQTDNQCQRIKLFLEETDLDFELVAEHEIKWQHWLEDPQKKIRIIPKAFPKALRFNDEKVIFLTDSNLLGQKRSRISRTQNQGLETKAKALSFGELKEEQLVVHKLHGVALYQGLKVMSIGGAKTEMIQLQYKGGDKLYLPVYRIGQIHKYSGPQNQKLVDKLGGTGWEKTKVKVQNKLRDLAAELLNLYSQRSKTQRDPFSKPDQDFMNFENQFQFVETDDQLKAIQDVTNDLTGDKPMDRLVCGDVGFGKTEIAMRAAFKVVQDGKQTAILAPTTILTFQHFKNFKKRFAGYPMTIEALHRFIPNKEVKQILERVKKGEVDILLGTHRLLSKDIEFKSLGLLVIDEEQRFGVKHKEKIRKLKVGVDTLAMSATPIPRTLNMSLMGIRDLSLISTPPVDRLPTRTFICRFEGSTIKKAVESELKRGGQVFFLHNRIHSIESLATDLRQLLPGVKIKVAHGQMEENQLEVTMTDFFNKKIDILLCTTIIESGMDIPNANTMFIDSAHQLGLSQLYQLRGRVGRSKERAYCYLLIPKNKKLNTEAQERLKVIQENTALGSGIRIAQHDLELRGAGNILGEDQSGHVNAVGYELYLELLEEAIREQRGDELPLADLEPEINIRVSALIPDFYISDIRIRLSYYKYLSDIQNEEDLDKIEAELKDQFGSLPEEVTNLMGLMLLRLYCRQLGIKDLSAGKTAITLTFTKNTPISPDKIVRITSQENKKFSLTPNNHLHIRMKDLTWPRIYDELVFLKSL